MSDFPNFIIGLIINPISGMGGSVGLKGTDGREILQKAIDLGAKPNALNRVRELLGHLDSIKSRLTFLTCPGIMGASLLNELGFDHETLNHPDLDDYEDICDTSSRHTRVAARLMKNRENLKLILFIGGDGTARDVLDAVKMDKPCLGVPAGVKIYSSVFALNPRIASTLIMQYLWEEIPLLESEVLDIDEDEYRKGSLVSKIYGHLLIPHDPNLCQTSKMGSPESDLSNQERIAKRIIESLENDVYYLIGPGTTTRAITDQLHQEKTILGVDLMHEGKVIAKDLNEAQILDHMRGKKVKIIVSLIGRQGFLFGRGNLQFTPTILRMIGAENILIISTKFKLQNIPNQILRLDTRDPELDKEMKGLYKIIVDYYEIRICEVK